MITIWLVTLSTLMVAALLIGVALHFDRGAGRPPRSHFCDPQFHSPMSAS